MSDEKQLDFVHTKEPWKLRGKYSIIGEKDGPEVWRTAQIAKVRANQQYRAEAVDQANAQRIVDCVNACAGYEISEVKDALKRWEREQELLTICDGWDTEEVREILSCASSVKHSDVDRGLAREKIALWKNEWTAVE